MRVTGAIYPAISANTNDWAPAGFETTELIVVTVTGTRDLTGIAAGSKGRTIPVFVAGAGTLTLKDASASSAVGNRFAIGADVAITAGYGFWMSFDQTNAVWRVARMPAAATPISIANGGTGQTSQTSAFDALAPTTTQGDVIYHNGSDNVRLAKGTAGQILKMNAGATAPEWGAATSMKMQVQEFTSSGTFTPNAAMIAAGGVCEVFAVGGGGAGGGATTTYRCGGGGGGGEIKRQLLTGVTSAQTVTVGAGGAGVSGAAGNTGSSTTFGALLTATGGGGGGTSGAGSQGACGGGGGVGGGSSTTRGAGGGGGMSESGTNADVFAGGTVGGRGTAGGRGGRGAAVGVASNDGGSGGCGAEGFGGGGGAAHGTQPGIASTGGGNGATSGTGNAATANTGSGGGGAAYSSGSVAGGAGGSGIVRVIWWE